MAAVPPVSQQLVDMYQQQISQMQDLERRQQEEFQRDLEGQKRTLESKQQGRNSIALLKSQQTFQQSF